MKGIITGANGQDGSYLAQFLLANGYSVISLLRNKKSNIDNHRILGIDHQINYVDIDLTNIDSVIALLFHYQPDEIYNHSAQSSVSRSFLSL